MGVVPVRSCFSYATYISFSIFFRSIFTSESLLGGAWAICKHQMRRHWKQHPRLLPAGRAEQSWARQLQVAFMFVCGSNGWVADRNVTSEKPSAKWTPRPGSGVASTSTRFIYKQSHGVPGVPGKQKQSGREGSVSSLLTARGLVLQAVGVSTPCMHGLSHQTYVGPHKSICSGAIGQSWIGWNPVLEGRLWSVWLLVWLVQGSKFLLWRPVGMKQNRSYYCN